MRTPKAFRPLAAALRAGDKAAALAAIAGLSDYERDLLVPCGKCQAGETRPCVPQPDDAAPVGEAIKVVHFARRLARLQKGIK